MKVILLQNVPGVGRADEVKDVADGYARNFLFARHLAVPASTKATSDLMVRHKKADRDAERDLSFQQNLAEKVEGSEIKISEKSSGSGHLYAAVTAKQISTAMKSMGFDVSSDQIVTKPLKESGTYPIKIKFRHGLEAKIFVVIKSIIQ